MASETRGDRRPAISENESVIVETKLVMPEPLPWFVQSDTALDALSDAPSNAVILLAAPAGFGKTCVAGAAARASDRPVLWFSLDGRDANPGRFWRHLTTGLERLEPLELPKDPMRLRGVVLSSLDSLELEVIPQFINRLQRLPKGVTIVLDGLDHLAGSDALRQLGFVIEQVPNEVQFVLTCRTLPDLPLARLRSHGRLLQLGPDELSLSFDECAELITQRLGNQLSDEALRGIWSVSEGWPAVVYLAALATERSGPISGADTGWKHRDDIIEYVTEEALLTFPPAELDALQELSILPELNQALTDAVLGPDAEPFNLWRLDEQSMFTTRLASSGWIRLHPVLRLALRRRLETNQPQLVHSRYSRAIDWCVANDRLDRGVGIAIESGDQALLVELLRDVWSTLWSAGHIDVIDSALDALDEPLVAADPVLAVLAGCVGLETGEASLAEEYEDLARTADTTGSHVTLIDVLIARKRLWLGDLAGARERLARVTLAPPIEFADDFHWLLTVPTALWSGKIDHAIDLGERVLADTSEDALMARTSLHGYLGLAHAHQLRLDEAMVHTSRGLDELEAANLTFLPEGAPLSIASALTSRRLGDPTAAIATLDRATSLRRSGPLLKAYAALVYAGACRELGNSDDAREAVGRARHHLELCPDPGPLIERVWEVDSRGARRQSYSVDGEVEQLTERELEQLRLFVTDFTQREMALRLGVSMNTVKSRNRTIFRKLGARSRLEATEIARRAGLL